ncbi:hypothetical protein Lepto7375DRAFT_8111 [Leptolyngbya sp. PCC 7375]|nr:hypothetical protein Lepto7375DRAFT_8111 [Leptolyngbya sp. PCC 7375]
MAPVLLIFLCLSPAITAFQKGQYQHGQPQTILAIYRKGNRPIRQSG